MVRGLRSRMGYTRVLVNPSTSRQVGHSTREVCRQRPSQQIPWPMLVASGKSWKQVPAERLGSDQGPQALGRQRQTRADHRPSGARAQSKCGFKLNDKTETCAPQWQYRWGGCESLVWCLDLRDKEQPESFICWLGRPQNGACFRTPRTWGRGASRLCPWRGALTKNAFVSKETIIVSASQQLSDLKLLQDFSWACTTDSFIGI